MRATVDLQQRCFTLAGDDTSRLLTPQLRHYASMGSPATDRQ